MKKTLLSVLAGLTVIGSASAAPTPEDRKELCQLLIDKGTHVWVEKTQACIPVRTCALDRSEDIRKAYCLNDVYLPAEQRAINLFSKKYAENILKTQIKEIKKYDSNEAQTEDLKNTWFVAITTQDGGYYVYTLEDSDSVLKERNHAYTAAKAYMNIERFADYKNKHNYTLQINKEMCENIENFRKSLYIDTNTVLTYEEGKGCVFLPR